MVGQSSWLPGSSSKSGQALTKLLPDLMKSTMQGSLTERAGWRHRARPRTSSCAGQAARTCQLMRTTERWASARACSPLSAAMAWGAVVVHGVPGNGAGQPHLLCRHQLLQHPKRASVGP